MIHIVDYGAGNLGSIQNMLKRIGETAVFVNDSDSLSQAEKIILPGVGHFDYGMSQLKNSGLVEILNHKVIEEKVPVLGICLGAQMMCKSSEEGSLGGLGWFDADVKLFNFDNQKSLRVPHMGWNYVSQKKQSKIFPESETEKKFYFVHKYHMVANDDDMVLMETEYGYNFVSALEKNNIYALQFHPEKSHKFGMELFRNFVNL